MNYERIIQWVSGPFSVAVGGVATKLVAAHGGLLSAVGANPKSAAHTVTEGVVFATSAAVTYAGHHKWLDNAAKWWEKSGLTLPSVLTGDTPPPDTTDTTGTPAGTVPAMHAVVALDNAEKLREQLRAAGMTPEA